MTEQAAPESAKWFCKVKCDGTLYVIPPMDYWTGFEWEALEASFNGITPLNLGDKMEAGSVGFLYGMLWLGMNRARPGTYTAEAKRFTIGQIDVEWPKTPEEIAAEEAGKAKAAADAADETADETKTPPIPGASSGTDDHPNPSGRDSSDEPTT